MPESSPPQHARSDAERNRRSLLSAAAEELARNPGASMIEIAHAAHLTRATLYRHFGTRERLVEGLRAEALAAAADALAASELDRGPALEALRRAVQALAALGARFRPLLVEGADLDPGFLTRRTAVLAPLRDVVRRGQQEGAVRVDLSPDWVVAALASMLAAGVRALPAGTEVEIPLGELAYRTLVEGIRRPTLN